MFKFLVLGVFLLCAVVKDSFGQPLLPNTETAPDILVALKNDSKIELTNPQKNGQYNFYASHQTFYVGGPSARKHLTGFTSNDFGSELNTDYHATKGIGAHKLHLRKLPWNRARRICNEEGGHLAVIATESEEKILLQMIAKDATEGVWIGYHDLFEGGDWVSVLDEPLAKTGWARWSKKFPINPSGGDQHCAQLLKDGGMDDTSCADRRAFICKVPIDE